MEFRSAHHQLPFQFELDDCNGLMHLLIQLQVLRVIVLSVFNGKNIAVGIGISIHGKGGERNEIDAVAFLQGREIGITQGEADDIADAGIIARSSTHPQHIMIAPLDVPAVVAAHLVEDDMRTRTTVVDIAQDMQLVDGKALDDIGDGNDESSARPVEMMVSTMTLTYAVLS